MTNYKFCKSKFRVQNDSADLLSGFHKVKIKSLADLHSFVESVGMNLLKRSFRVLQNSIFCNCKTKVPVSLMATGF